MIIGFDRDLTIDVNEGPIPLDWVIQLRAVHKVYAIGNPLLGPEAGIQTHRDIKQRAGALGLQTKIYEPDWANWPVVPVEQRSNIEGKFRRLSRLAALHPDEKTRISVDDYPLYRMPGWTYWTPGGFYKMGLDYWLTGSK